MAQVDDKFYERADEHIRLSNQQLSHATRGIVSASMLYSVARFNAWVNATGFEDAGEMAAAKEETIHFFVEEYRMMLSEIWMIILKTSRRI